MAKSPDESNKEFESGRSGKDDGVIGHASKSEDKDYVITRSKETLVPFDPGGLLGDWIGHKQDRTEIHDKMTGRTGVGTGKDADAKAWDDLRSKNEARPAPITAEGVYEGASVVKLDQPIALEAGTRVSVIIEADAPTADDDDPTGWKMADELIGFMKDGPKGPIGEQHDDYLYRRR